jgi:hypothetical protein
MLKSSLQLIFVTAAAVGFSTASAQDKSKDAGWQKDFNLASCNLQTSGRSEYFILEPGFQLVLEDGDTKMHLTILDETRQVDGVMTRVVEEREWKNGKLHEVTKNYFAICEQTKDVFYFGEDVDYYENDKIVRHDGTWLAGTKGSKPGLVMPGKPKVGMKYYQELAPGVAMDRAEIVSLSETCKTPAGTFKRCMKVKEGTALDPKVSEYKYFAPGIGLVRDEDLQLVKHGFIKGQ